MKNKKKEEDLVLLFMNRIMKLEIEELIGITTILKIKILEKGEVKTFVNIFDDILEKYKGLGEKQQKELLEVVTIAVLPEKGKKKKHKKKE